jgi:hypothetical protein
MTKELEQFQSLVKPWLGGYEYARVAVVGIHEQGKETILSARILLAADINPIQETIALDGPILWAKAKVVPFSADFFDQSLDGLVAGKLLTGGTEAQLAVDQNQTPYSKFVPGYLPAAVEYQSAPRLPALLVTGGNRNTFLNRVLNTVGLEWFLRALNPPFADLTDLHTYYGLPVPGDPAFMEFLAKPPLEMDGGSIIENGQAYIRVIAAKGIDRKEVVVGYRGFGGSSGEIRGRVTQEMFKWAEIGKLVKGEALVDAGDTPTLQCFLSYAGSGLQQWWIADSKRLLNPRHAIQSAFDQDQTVLKRLLFESRRSDARSFEDGVAMLLGMLGFSVTQHGRTQKLSNAPDIIAITPGGHVAVVECTLGLPDQNDKTDKVLQRTETLRRALSNAGWPGVQLLPIVVTLLTKAEIEGQRKAAESKGVVIISREDIESALIQVRIPVDADRLFQATMEGLRNPSIMHG